MRTIGKSESPRSVPINRHGRVELPHGLIRLRLGQRVYWRITDVGVYVSTSPPQFEGTRWVSSRVRRGTGKLQRQQHRIRDQRQQTA